jgi:hypothetical protein
MTPAGSSTSDAPHGPPVADKEELYRCSAHPNWCNDQAVQVRIGFRTSFRRFSDTARWLGAPVLVSANALKVRPVGCR